LADDLLQRLDQFNAAPTLIHSFAQTLNTLGGEIATIHGWCRKLLTKCEEKLTALILPHVSNSSTSSKKSSTASLPSLSENAELLKRYLFTLGEMVGLSQRGGSGSGCITKQMVTILQALLSLDRDQIKSNNKDLSNCIVPPSVRAYAIITLGKVCTFFFTFP